MTSLPQIFAETFGFTIEEAIKKSLEKGWRIRGDELLKLHTVGDKNVYFKGRGVDKKAFHIAEVLFDPSFWIHFGKAEGWGLDEPNKMWLHYQHRFIDAIAEDYQKGKIT